MWCYGKADDLMQGFRNAEDGDGSLLGMEEEGKMVGMACSVCDIIFNDILMNPEN